MSLHNENRGVEDLDVLQDAIEAAKADAPDEARYLAARDRLLESLDAQQQENAIMKTIRRATQGRIRWGMAAATAVLFER